jgi:hypothetical protein
MALKDDWVANEPVKAFVVQQTILNHSSGFLKNYLQNGLGKVFNSD